jgi:hypothetical protein
MTLGAWILLAFILVVGLGSIIWDTFIAPERRGRIRRR